MRPHDSPELVQELPRPSAPAGGRAPAASLVADGVRQVCRLLRTWSAEHAAVEDNCTALALRLEDEQKTLGVGLLEAVLHGMEFYRRIHCILHVTQSGTPLGRSSAADLGPTTYTIEALAPTGSRIRLRREMPFAPEDVPEFLAKAGAGKSDELRAMLTDIVHEAVRAVLGGPEQPPRLLRPLERLHDACKGRGMRTRAGQIQATLDEPAPEGLQRSVQALLVGAADGCLTPGSEVRLFRHAARVTPPFLAPQEFEEAQAAVESLRRCVAQQPCPATLRQVCAKLDLLGTFARRLQPILTGPSAGAHHDWARLLLENFSRLGLVARSVLGGPLSAPPPPKEPAPAPETSHGPRSLDGSAAPQETAPPPAVAAEAASAGVSAGPPPVPAVDGPPPQQPPAEAAPPEAVTEVVAAGAEPLVEAAQALVQESPPPEPTPEEAALAELAPTHRVVVEFRDILALAQELKATLDGRWDEAEEALRELHYPGKRFQEALVRAAKSEGEERSRVVKRAARELADEFVNKIRGFDALLPGKGNPPLPFLAPAHFTGEGRDDLARKVRALRDRLFQVMQAYGNYAEHQAAVGESVRKYQDLDIVFVSNTRGRQNEILQILLPGYVRRRGDGTSEPIRSPKVKVAR